jgi:hypothetical protein
MTTGPPNDKRPPSSHATARLPTSVVLHDLLGEVPAERVTLGWLLGRLGGRSFGIVLILLGLLGTLPGVSAVAGVLLSVPACQMILARPGPVFPRRVIDRQFEARRLAGAIRRSVPVLRFLERLIRPRWPTPFEATKRVVGFVVLLLGASLLAPVPLSNVPPALLIVLTAFAYLEEDGVLLCAALVASLLLFVALAAAGWQTLSTTGWVPGLL